MAQVKRLAHKASARRVGRKVATGEICMFDCWCAVAVLCLYIHTKMNCNSVDQSILEKQPIQSIPIIHTLLLLIFHSGEKEKKRET